MSAVITEDVLQGEIAVTVAKVLAAANKCAEAAGINALECLISVNQRPHSEGGIWEVEYSHPHPVGRRGGGLTVDVDPQDATIKRVLRGQ